MTSPAEGLSSRRLETFLLSPTCTGLHRPGRKSPQGMSSKMPICPALGGATQQRRSVPAPETRRWGLPSLSQALRREGQYAEGRMSAVVGRLLGGWGRLEGGWGEAGGRLVEAGGGWGRLGGGWERLGEAGGRLEGRWREAGGRLEGGWGHWVGPIPDTQAYFPQKVLPKPGHTAASSAQGLPCLRRETVPSGEGSAWVAGGSGTAVCTPLPA